jgi:hypothetical protein
MFMPDLAHALPTKDIGFLRIVASLWGIDLTSSDSAAASVELAEALCDADLVEEVVSTLSDEGRAALSALAAEGGRIPWVIFVRHFGDVREMGAGRRDREQPHRHPASPAEVLWYRGLVARAFFDTSKGPQEFAYIPAELYQALGFIGFGRKDESDRGGREEEEEVAVLSPVVTSEPLGRPALPGEKVHPITASDRLLDDACTLLAALRMGVEPPETHVPVRVVREFLAAAKIVEDGVPQPGPVKTFLELGRGEALAMLGAAWRESDTFNELRQLPGLAFEGDLRNDARATRATLLDFLAWIQVDQWWSLSSIVKDVKEKHPDFQRPAGDYDSWFIKRTSDDSFLRGFDSWDDVDGALVKYLITGPMFWLSMVDLACPETGADVTAFRLLDVERLAPVVENGKLHVSSQGRITVPCLVPRAVRYQIARYCDWDEALEDVYNYRVTPESLSRAKKQGLKTGALLKLLQKHGAAPVPPSFQRALQRWEINGIEARIEESIVLKVSKPHVLEELRKSKAARFLGESLGPTAVVVKPGAQAKVLAALAELGLLTEVVHSSR